MLSTKCCSSILLFSDTVSSNGNTGCLSQMYRLETAMGLGARLTVWLGLGAQLRSPIGYPRGAVASSTWHSEEPAAPQQACPELAENKSCQLAFVPNPPLPAVQSTEGKGAS